MQTILSFNAAFAIQTHTKIWTSGMVIGALSNDKKILYYAENDARFIDDKYKFSQELLWLGLGYRIAPYLTVYAGDAPNVTRNLNGTYTHQNIPWQQLSWVIRRNDNYTLESGSRLEEIKRMHQSEWRLLFREMILFKAPFNHWKDHALVMSDSVFFNLNNPAWAQSPTFISQNRAFIGIETQLTKNAYNTIGYMNQYLFGDPNQMNNVLVISFSYLDI